MPPRLNLFSVPRALAFRSKPAFSAGQFDRVTRPTTAPILRRSFADSKDSQAKGPNTDTLPTVSEEAASMAKTQQVTPPEIEQGTPVAEYLKNNKEAQDKLPKVMKDALKTSPSKPSGTRSFSTSTRRQEAESNMVSAAETNIAIPPATPGLKFHMPSIPIPSDGHLKYRYDPVVKQLTNLLMEHGEAGKAQRNMSRILEHLRTAPAPRVDPRRPLLPGAPPAFHLPLNPVLYLTLAIDSVAPLMRIRQQKGAAGGGVALQIPVPLGLRQRRRASIEWILSAASKKRNRISGKGTFAQRVAEELVAVVQGTSAVWERRNAQHRMGVAARANINILRTQSGQRKI